jgi:hypothetical protein
MATENKTTSWWLEDKELYNEIVTSFKERARVQGYKPGTAKFRQAQMEFFIGASTALRGIPPSWYVSIIRDDEIICKPEDVQASDVSEG